MKIGTSPIKIGHVVKHEQFPQFGYCRKIVSATLTPTSDLGDVLQLAGGETEYKLYDAADTPDNAVVLVDESILDVRPESGTAVVDVVVLFRGACGVSDGALTATVTAGAQTTALHNLLEDAGIQVLTQSAQENN